MTSDPRAFFTLDLGAATTAAALIGRIDGRWHLLGALACPSGIEPETILTRLAERVLGADDLIAETIGAADLGPPAEWPRLESRSAPPPRLAVLAASGSTLERLETTAEAAGWNVTGGSLEDDDVLDLVRASLEPGRATILAGTADPPGGPERGRARALSELVEALATRRPDGALILSGGLATGKPAVVDIPETGLDPDADGTVADAAERLFAPAPGGWSGIGSDRRSVAWFPRAPAIGRPSRFDLDRPCRRVACVGPPATHRGRRDRPRRRAAGGGLAAGPDRRRRGSAGHRSCATFVPDAGLVPEVLDDEYVDEVMAWSTIPFDRIRLRDRLSELRRAPWGDPDGDGAALRLAAARAALGRLVAATPSFADLPAPDLIVAAGGAFCAAPGPAVALALADMLRRSGACGLALDHARLLGPLGTIPDEGERRAMIADLADELLAPLGSVISPQGMHAGRSAGRVTVHGSTGSTELDLVPGGLQLVDLPPGQVATAEFEFRDTVRLGTRGRHFAVEVAGGLGGLLVDLRDIPLRMPDRLEHRRELLAAWQGALWVGADR